MTISFAAKRCGMEKLYEEICAIFTSTGARRQRAEELSELYGRLGNASVALDNMLYDRLGLSCEDLIDMLHKGDVKIS